MFTTADGNQLIYLLLLENVSISIQKVDNPKAAHFQ